ncbi:MAG TPA: UbiA-like polyprenyltransferase [Candidatus Acidoferrales bacterium]|nr:UbiA-like polyprenyltransferase [Candidatus Acidoferrales bacterium]
MISSLRRFFEELKVEHTLFALPFAYAGALLGARGIPSLHALAWITIAVLGARTAAMAANRLLDARLDAKNPRTARRHVASGKLPAAWMVWAIVAGLVLLTIAAWQLNPLCLALLPIGVAALVIYPLVKRWTWAVHFVLGAVDGLAPLGAWIAVTGKIELGGILLFCAVTMWVAGFDIWYALMDRDFDLAQGVRSIPARFGVVVASWLPELLHGLVVVALAWLGFVIHARPLYWVGILFAAMLLVYETVLVARQRDTRALNTAVFNANMLFSVAFFVSTAASVIVT